MIRESLSGLAVLICLAIGSAAVPGQPASKGDAGVAAQPQAAATAPVRFVSATAGQSNAVTYSSRPYDVPVRPKWHYREPTCSPSRAQIRWAQLLPNYNGLRGRGLADEEIVAYFAPNEVKCLDGETLPDHLVPRPDVVYINERCKDGTCTTGYCEASRKNAVCKDGRCPLPSR